MIWRRPWKNIKFTWVWSLARNAWSRFDLNRVPAQLTRALYHGRDFIPTHPVEVFKFAVKHGYTDVIKTQAIQAKPMEMYQHAVATQNRELIDEAVEHALLKQPVTVFRHAVKHRHIELAKSVALKVFKLQLSHDMDEVWVSVLLTSHIFEVLQFATEQKLTGLMNAAAKESRQNNPDLSIAATVLDRKALVAWVSRINLKCF